MYYNYDGTPNWNRVNKETSNYNNTNTNNNNFKTSRPNFDRLNAKTYYENNGCYGLYCYK